MKLNALEFALMNNPLRAASQRWIETPLLLGSTGALTAKRVLEIGCGRGVGIELLLARGAAQVTGLDLDPAMIRLADARVALSGNRASVVIGSASALPVPDTIFDAVFDYGVIHHIPDWPATLQEIARVLVPGGSFYFEDLSKGLIGALPMRALFEHPQATQFTASEFRTMVEASSLRIVRWRQIGTWGFFGQAMK